MNTDFEKFMAPIKEINELTVKNFEAIAEMQIKVAEENVSLSLEQAKSAANVKDAESWKDYMNSQAVYSQQLNERIIENARGVVELSNAYNTEVQKIVKGMFSA